MDSLSLPSVDGGRWRRAVIRATGAELAELPVCGDRFLAADHAFLQPAGSHQGLPSSAEQDARSSPLKVIEKCLLQEGERLLGDPSDGARSAAADSQSRARAASESASGPAAVASNAST